MRAPLLAIALSTLPLSGLAETETFHGWSKDGTYLVWETSGPNEGLELYFCATDSTVTPTWPNDLNEMDHFDEKGLPCVRFIDPNKAPYQWKKSLVLAAPSLDGGGGFSVRGDLSTEVDQPGFVIEAGGKEQVCSVSSVRDESKLQKVWWHSSHKWVMASIDGHLHHCAVQLKAGKAPPKAPGKKK